MSDASADFERDLSFDPKNLGKMNDPFSIENLVASHPIFSRMSLMACQVI
jgi:hypothetical protein